MGITCAYYNFTTVQSNGFAETITVQNDDHSPVDITDATIRFYGRLTQDTAIADTLFDLQVGSGITITDGPNGIFVVSADETDMGFDALSFAFADDRMSVPYWCELTVADASVPQTILWGPLTVIRS